MNNITIATKSGASYRTQLVIIGSFFFMFGFVTWVNGTLIPYLRIACELKDWQPYLVTFAFYISYTIMALPSSKILQFTGMINGIRTGLLIMVLGCLIFIPAALTRSYLLFLIGLFIVGTGLTLLQTAINPYITLIGPSSSAAQRISIMGICNKFAGIIAPFILSAIILSNADALMEELSILSPAAKQVRLDALAHDVIVPYAILAGILLLVSFGIKYARLPEVDTQTTDHSDDGHLSMNNAGASRNGQMFRGFLAIFCAVGVEVVAGDTISNYGIYNGISLDIAKSLTSLTLAGMLAGYIIGIITIPKYISQNKAYLYSAMLGLVFSALILFSSGWTSIIGVALLGFANAMLWPAIWPKALEGLTGKTLNNASAILIMGIAGGAILPLIYGWVSTGTNNKWGYMVVIPCYIYSIYYSKRGKP